MQASRALGYGACLLSAICFSLMAIFIHDLQGVYNSFEVLFYRSVIIFSVTVFFSYKEIPLMFTRSGMTLWLRSLFGVVAILCYFYCLQHVHVSVAAMMHMLTPVFLLILVFIFLRERLSFYQLLGIGIILATEFYGKSSKVVEIPDNIFYIGLFGAFLGGLAFLFLKFSTNKFSGMGIMTAFSFLSLVAMLPLVSDVFSFNQKGHWPSLVIIASVTLIGHLLLIYGFRKISPSIANFFLKSIVLWTALWEFLVNHRAISFSEILLYAFLLIGIFMLGIERKKMAKQVVGANPQDFEQGY